MKSIFIRVIKRIGKVFFIKRLKWKNKIYGMKKMKTASIKRLVIGYNCRIMNNCRLEAFDSYHQQKLNGSIMIGDRTILMQFCTILSGESVKIGNNCLIGSFVLITDLNHGIDLSIEDCFEMQNLTSKKVRIGNNCWIGEKATILQGVTIGDNCVVGANSVVSKDVPSNCVVAGIPAKIIKRWDEKNKCWMKV